MAAPLRREGRGVLLSGAALGAIKACPLFPPAPVPLPGAHGSVGNEGSARACVWMLALPLSYVAVQSRLHRLWYLGFSIC